jgi:hypothetical protein
MSAPRTKCDLELKPSTDLQSPFDHNPNQAAIIALFRVMNRFVGKRLAPAARP